MPGSTPSPLSDPPAPRVLVADDDAGSRRFLADALTALGALTETAEDGAAALALARRGAFALLLLDCRMPGQGALEVLTALRADPAAHSRDSVAVATTAEAAPANRAALLAAGFSAVLVKPCTLAELDHLLALAVPGCPRRLLDDAAALVASGDRRTMQALRSLLLGELAQLDGEIDGLRDDPHGFTERLHRLRSSCGFCGASALATQARQLEHELAGGAALPSLQRFRTALAATMQALDQAAAAD